MLYPMLAKPRYPILYFTLPFLAGAVLAKLPPFNNSLPLVFILFDLGILAVIAVLAKHQPIFNGIFWINLALMSFFSGNWLSIESSKLTGLDQFEPPRMMQISGVIEQQTETKNGQFLLVRSQSVRLEGLKPVRCVDLLQVYFPSKKRRYKGSQIVCQGKLRRQSPSTSFQEVNWFAIREEQSINHIMWIQDTSRVKVIQSSWWEDQLANYNQILSSKIRNSINSPGNQILEAMLLGNKSTLEPGTKKVFRESGTAHVLAISGLHAGILYVFVLWILRIAGLAIGYRGLLPIAVALACLWVYACLTGMQPPIMRTTILLTLLQTGRLLFREISSITLLSFIAVVFVLYDPLLLWNTGFELSFLAVSGILLFYPHLIRMAHGKSKVIRYIWGLISVSIAAQSFILPLMLFRFHYLPTYFIIASLFAVPLTGLILTGTFATLLFGAWVPWIQHWGWKGIDLLTKGLFEGLNLFQDLPYSNLGPVHFPGFALIPLTLFMVLCLYAFAARPSFPATLFGGILFAGTASYLLMQRPSSVLVESTAGLVIIHFMDKPFCYDWIIQGKLPSNPESGQTEELPSTFHLAYDRIGVLLPKYYSSQGLYRYRDLVQFNSHWYTTESAIQLLSKSQLSNATIFAYADEKQCMHDHSSKPVYCSTALQKQGFQWIE